MCGGSPARRMMRLSWQLHQPLTSCIWCQRGMYVGMHALCSITFFVRRAEMLGLYYLTCWLQNYRLNPSPLRPTSTPSTPHLCPLVTKGHKEDLTSVLSYGCCWDLSASTSAEDLLSCLQGRWKRFGLWSQSSPTLATFSYIQVFACACKKEDGQVQRCPGLLLTWVVGTVGVNSPLAFPSWWCLSKRIPKARQENLSVEEHGSGKGVCHCKPIAQTSSVV